MLMHSFVLDALETTGADTFSHFEMLIEEHIQLQGGQDHPSRLKQLVPTVGTFHTALPLRKAFLSYNEKHQITKRRHVAISFNELRHILNLAQIMAMRREGAGCPIRAMGSSNDLLSDADKEGEDNADSCDDVVDTPDGPFNGPGLITFDGDQTLYTDGANFESNPRLANYIYLLLKHGVAVAVVTAAGYEYNVEKYEFRLSGLIDFFKARGLTEEECERFYLFGGECNYLLHVSTRSMLMIVVAVIRDDSCTYWSICRLVMSVVFRSLSHMRTHVYAHTRSITSSFPPLPDTSPSTARPQLSVASSKGTRPRWLVHCHTEYARSSAQLEGFRREGFTRHGRRVRHQLHARTKAPRPHHSQETVRRVDSQSRRHHSP